jgi:hypothetical protein
VPGKRESAYGDDRKFDDSHKSLLPFDTINKIGIFVSGIAARLPDDPTSLQA